LLQRTNVITLAEFYAIVVELLRHRAVVVPDILVEQPRIAATQDEDGSTNYLFPALSSEGNGPGAMFGNLRITGGQAHVVLARQRDDDFNVVMETRDTDNKPHMVAEAKGTYVLANGNGPLQLTMAGGGDLSALLAPRRCCSLHRSMVAWHDPMHACGGQPKQRQVRKENRSNPGIISEIPRWRRSIADGTAQATSPAGGVARSRRAHDRRDIVPLVPRRRPMLA
jgi:hypothetical protein